MFIAKEHADKEEYSVFSRFILSEIPMIKNKPKIWDALLTASGVPKNTSGKDAAVRYRKDGVMRNPLNETLAKMAITVGMPPKVIPRELPVEEYGMFYTKTPGCIYVNESWIQKFQKDSWYEPARKLILATVIHELVHYLDYAKDNTFLDCQRDDIDRGFLFEELAYGSRVEEWKSPSD